MNLNSLTCETKIGTNASSNTPECATTITTPLTEREIKQGLHDMGVDVLEPESEKEKLMAEALDAFSSFILHDEQDKCRTILDTHINSGDSSSVGELQGGSDQHSIYRVLISDDDNDEDRDNNKDAAADLLKEFHSSYQGKRYSNSLTIHKLKQYMLAMCERRSKTCCDDDYNDYSMDNRTDHLCSRKYVKLDNLMFILSFGSINGQVRHIDNMVPNLQICLYMSSDCPSTIVYTMDGPPITNVNKLIDYWTAQEQLLHVPDLIKAVLIEKGDKALSSKWYTKYFAFWDTINSNLNCFGKLYQPVSLQLSLTTDPGTTLLAGGNEVHAGPPAPNARMFAFAIGILEDSGSSETNDYDESEYYESENNGEVQYSPVLLHVDLCCIVFSLIDFEYSDQKDTTQEAKLFLITVLIALVKDFPKETYDRQMGDERREVRDWLGKVLDTLEKQEGSSNVDKLVEEALKSDIMFYSPDIKKRRMKKKKRRNAKSSC